MIASTPKQIVFLLEPQDKIVAHLTEMGEIAGEFHQTAAGEVYFTYHQQSERRWYVNKDINAFQQAAAIFNRFCHLHANDENTDDVTAWSLMTAQLKRELEQIEPLGDPDTSLWSTTIHDTEWSLLSLH